MKVVINRCYGGFGLSEKAILRYLEIKGKEVWVEPDKWSNTYWLVAPENRMIRKHGEEFYSMSIEDRIKHNRKLSEETFYYTSVERDDPVLVQVVEELGEQANGDYAKLEIVEIPDDVNWEIDEYDGIEHIAEKHRTWS
jgi:hypothetical protein